MRPETKTSIISCVKTQNKSIETDNKVATHLFLDREFYSGVNIIFQYSLRQYLLKIRYSRWPYFVQNQ